MPADDGSDFALGKYVGPMANGLLLGLIVGAIAFNQSAESFPGLGLWPVLVLHGSVWMVSRLFVAAMISEQSAPVSTSALTGLFAGAGVVGIGYASGLGLRPVSPEINAAIGVAVGAGIVTVFRWVRKRFG